jgi:hypothetical protein
MKINISWSYYIILLYSNNITGLINRQIELISGLTDAIILSNNINV